MSGKSKKILFPCPHNTEVACWYKEKPCATCGWNPEVEKARLDKIKSTPRRTKTATK